MKIWFIGFVDESWKIGAVLYKSEPVAKAACDRMRLGSEYRQITEVHVLDTDSDLGLKPPATSSLIEAAVELPDIWVGMINTYRGTVWSAKDTLEALRVRIDGSWDVVTFLKRNEQPKESDNDLIAIVEIGHQYERESAPSPDTAPV